MNVNHIKKGSVFVMQDKIEQKIKLIKNKMFANKLLTKDEFALIVSYMGMRDYLNMACEIACMREEMENELG